MAGGGRAATDGLPQVTKAFPGVVGEHARLFQVRRARAAAPVLRREEVATVVAGVTEMAAAREEETAAPSGTMKAEPNLILPVITTVIITLPFVLPRYANAVEKIARK